MFLFGSTKFDGKSYTYDDITGMVPLAAFNVPSGFYGGRVKQFAKCDKTAERGIYLCLDKTHVIDIMCTDLELLTIKNLQDILDKKRIAYQKRDSKDTLLALLGHKKPIDVAESLKAAEPTKDDAQDDDDSDEDGSDIIPDGDDPTINPDTQDE